MMHVRDKMLSSAFGFVLFDKWPDMPSELKSESDQMMYRALELASMGVRRTHPNPPVGAVVARRGEVVAEGFHERAGLAHAEAKALKAAGDVAKGAELYVTLEPCNHFGRTPPCSLAVIESGVSKAYIGTLDPNPKVEGGGLGAVRKAGVEAGLIENAFLRSLAENMIAPFTTTMMRKRTYVVLQIADSEKVSSAAHDIQGRLRDRCDALISKSALAGPKISESLSRLAESGLTSILVEGDVTLQALLMDEGLVDEIWCFDREHDWPANNKHQRRDFVIDRDQLTITRIQNPL